MQKLNLVVIILTVVALGLWFLVNFLGWFSMSLSVTTPVAALNSYTYYTTGYNWHSEIKSGGGQIISDTWVKYSNQTDYSCSNCAASDKKCNGYCGLYGIMGSVSILNWFIIVFIAGVIIALLVSYCFSKSQTVSKLIYEITYFWLILSMLVAGGLFFVFDIIACSHWSDIKTTNEILNYSFALYLFQ